MRRLSTPPQGVLGVALLAAGLWEVLGWGYALIAVGLFFLLAELLRST